tara:strand:- start:116 stop:616 length:501 start_codon:yes stop_codon:yes gene_type:complete
MFKKIQALVSGGKKAFEYVKPKPKVNKTKLDKAMSNLNIELQKTKATGAKLKQTKFEIENPKFKGKDFTFKKDKGKSETNKEAYKRIQKQNTKVFKSMIDDAFKKGKDLEKKAKGGRVGRKGGGDLGMQSVKYGLDNNPKITAADPKAKFIAAAKNKKKKSKKKII